MEAVGPILILALSTASPANPPWDASKASGFPGDQGRMFNGLPFPPGPLPPRPRETPVSTALPIEVAVVAAKAAVAACRGFHIGVTVIDVAGMPKLNYIADETAGNHAYTAFRKAYTALSFDRPSGQVGELTKTDVTVRNRVVGDGNLLTFAGGLPIYIRGKMVGAIGVSGAEPSAVDERCATAALRSIGARWSKATMK